MEVLDNVGLTESVDKMPAELSGGMSKRIGLARTLILKPDIMLYDEPTTGLDTSPPKK
jgi:phospholipid/cholesterol/gamma-HCH transport system ATP-binding protein